MMSSVKPLLIISHLMAKITDFMQLLHQVMTRE
jgi:hypothetical protein